MTGTGPIVDTSWVYAVPKAGAASATLLWTTPVQVAYEAVSEDGSQLATVTLSSATTPERCYYRYYSLAAPIPDSGAVLTNHQTSDLTLCDALPGAAPNRVRPAPVVTTGDALERSTSW